MMLGGLTLVPLLFCGLIIALACLKRHAIDRDIGAYLRKTALEDAYEEEKMEQIESRLVQKRVAEARAEVLSTVFTKRKEKRQKVLTRSQVREEKRLLRMQQQEEAERIALEEEAKRAAMMREHLRIVDENRRKVEERIRVSNANARRFRFPDRDFVRVRDQKRFSECEKEWAQNEEEGNGSSSTELNVMLENVLRKSIKHSEQHEDTPKSRLRPFRLPDDKRMPKSESLDMIPLLKVPLLHEQQQVGPEPTPDNVSPEFDEYEETANAVALDYWLNDESGGKDNPAIWHMI